MRRPLASVPLPRAVDGRLVLAVDVHLLAAAGRAHLPGADPVPHLWPGRGPAHPRSWPAVFDRLRAGAGPQLVDRAAGRGASGTRGRTHRAADHRRSVAGRRTGRVRRDFRHIHPKTSCPAGAPKSSHSGPGRPAGRKNSRPTPRHDVHTVRKPDTTKPKTKKSTTPRPRRTG